MNKLSLLFESPPWLIAVGVLIGMVYALVLYFKSNVPWGKRTNYMLALLRFLLVTQLTLLLFGPLIRQITNTVEPPSIVLAIDNSQSVSEIEDSLNLARFENEIKSLQNEISELGYLTEIRTLDGISDADDIQFDVSSSNLNEMLTGIQNDYESRNLSEVILFSDGLYNLGNNPAFHPLNFTVSTVGLGDTTLRPDFNLNALLYNKIAYQGNKFPIVAELLSYNLAGKTAKVVLEKDGRITSSKDVKINSQNQFDQIEFLAESEESGVQRFTVRAIPIAEEFITSNNSKEAFIDIVDGKEKILIVAAAPHPDIKAIKSALETNDNYEIVTFIQGINQYVDDKYDAAVLHQVPDKFRNYEQLLNKIRKDNIPSFFIYGAQSDLNRFNQLNGAVRIVPINNQSDNVFPAFNGKFDNFLYEPENIEALNNYPPVNVPFANYTILAQSQVMLYQKIGKVVTDKPLLMTQKSNDWSSAVLLGEGIWTWRLNEYALSQSHRAFDEMISKIIQFLSTKEDKRRFKVYPVKNEYLNNEVVIFETEVYNDIYEQTFGHKIDLKITDELNHTRSYSYVTSEKNSGYRISDLEKGIYTYTAVTEINQKIEQASGTFTVTDLQIETTKLTADHNLLKNIADQNGGKFYEKNQFSQLAEDLSNREMTEKIYSSEKYLAIINMKWGFFILIFFVSAEWFLRKFYGSY